GGARFEDAAIDSKWVCGTAAERETGTVERAPAGSTRRHAVKRQTVATVHSGFPDLQRSGNRWSEDAVRGRQYQPVPVGHVPLVVVALSAKRTGALLFGE